MNETLCCLPVAAFAGRAASLPFPQDALVDAEVAAEAPTKSSAAPAARATNTARLVPTPGRQTDPS